MSAQSSGIALTFALGIVSFDTTGQAALAAGAYLGLTALEGQFITPYAVGRSLELNPVVVFIAGRVLGLGLVLYRHVHRGADADHPSGAVRACPRLGAAGRISRRRGAATEPIPRTQRPSQGSP